MTTLEICYIHLAGRAICLGFHESSVGTCVHEETDNIWKTCLCFVTVSKRLKVIKPCYYFKWLYAISKFKKNLGLKNCAEVVILKPTLIPISESVSFHAVDGKDNHCDLSTTLNAILTLVKEIRTSLMIFLFYS